MQVSVLNELETEITISVAENVELVYNLKRKYEGPPEVEVTRTVKIPQGENTEETSVHELAATARAIMKVAGLFERLSKEWDALPAMKLPNFDGTF